MSNGNLTGWTTQNGSNTPLIPRSLSATNQKAYYNATGAFTVPSTLPFDGCVLIPVPLIVAPSGFGTMTWSEVTPGFDVGGHFDSTVSATKINCVTTGKYFVSFELNTYTTTPIDGLYATIEVVKAATPQVEADVFLAGSTTIPNYGRYLSASLMLDMSAGQYIQITVGSNSSTGGLVCGDDPIILGSYPHSGRLFFFRVG